MIKYGRFEREQQSFSGPIRLPGSLPTGRRRSVLLDRFEKNLIMEQRRPYLYRKQLMTKTDGDSGLLSDSSKHPPATVRGRPLLWLNVLCLDAPLVALGWQLLFARVFHLTLRSGETAALFLTAWGIYLVDRFVDSISPAPGTRRSVRADFCWRHKRTWAALLLLVLVLDGATIFTSLDRRVLIDGSFLGVVAVVYLLINHNFSKLWRTVPLKEMTVGFLFAAGTLIVLLPRAGPALACFVVTGLMFGSLCSLNCLSIAAWERELDLEQGKDSFATSHLHAEAGIRMSCLFLAAVCLVAAITFRAAWPVPACLALSAAILFILHFISVERNERTALADLVLLTPLLFLLGERLL